MCSSAPTTDARAISVALPSPARAVVLARANAALSELVPYTSAAERRELFRNFVAERDCAHRRQPGPPFFVRCEQIFRATTHGWSSE